MSVSPPASRPPFLATPLDAWRGRASLSTVFWGYGVLLSSALAAAFVAALYGDQAGAQQVLLFVFAAYTAWVLVSVWRCAEGASHPWGTVARLLTVTWAANAVLVGGFLQLRLLGL